MVLLLEFEHYLRAASKLVWGEFFLIPALAFTGLYLTLGLRGFQFRYFMLSLKTLLKRRNDKSKVKGEISSLQALMTALSATIGTGNIVGVAAAIQLGGRGAVFWMWIVAILGMATKFSEGFLAVKFREKDRFGSRIGGPMYYIKNGLGSRWAFLAITFAISGTVAAFGIGNTVQANAVAKAAQQYFHISANITGLLLAALTALVLIGGIKRIGSVAEKIVPGMAFMYIGMSLMVITLNYEMIPSVLESIVSEAFALPSAGGAGVWLALRWGFARGIFSNEAGLGSAAIAHAAARTNKPVEQGMIAMLGTFIDTILICTITALVILITLPINTDLSAALLSAKAFETVFGSLGGQLVAIALCLFAFTTILGWSYYGEKCAQYLFGDKIILPYRVIWIFAVYIGAITEFELIWLIADILNGLMALPNLIALVLLSPTIFKATTEFRKKI